jgi:hypothetical protein
MRTRTLLVAFVAVAASSRLLAADAGAWRLSHGDVQVTCSMTVGGTFVARTSALKGTLTEAPSQPFAGTIAVDLTTLDSGIALRNEHMRDDYLQVGRGEDYHDAVLSELKVSGVDPRTFSGSTNFTGTFLLHGTKKPIAGTARVRREGAAARIEATFTVPVADYGIPKPTYLGVGVKNEVQIKVSFLAEPTGVAQ